MSPKGTKENQVIQGSAYLPLSDKNTSTTAKQYGIIATLVVVMIIFKVFSKKEEMTNDKPIMYINNKEAIKRTDEKVDKKLTIESRMVADYDLWTMTNSITQQIPIQIEFKWIKSHQIDKGVENNEDPDNELDMTGAIINKEVDNLATMQYLKPYETIPRPHYQGAQVTFHQQGKHRQNIKKEIVELHETNNKINEYYKKKGWTEQQLQQIDWIALEKFLHKLTLGKRCNAVQLLHDWQNTNKQNATMERAKMMSKKQPLSQAQLDIIAQIADRPLKCGEVETSIHYVKCKSKKRRQEKH